LFLSQFTTSHEKPPLYFCFKKHIMTTKRISQFFLALMALAFCKVGLEALFTPHTVLANVGITLDNTSALSSMRAVYGGLHLAFGIFCLWGLFKKVSAPLILIALYTTGFVIGRVTSIIMDGIPNEFVITWLFTELFSLIVSVTLLYFANRNVKQEILITP
jgi:hypothetical protein